MHRAFSPVLIPGQTAVRIDAPDEARHLSVVLRLRAGDAVEVVDGKGHLGRGSVREAAKSRIEIDLESCVYVPPAQRPKVILACAIPKRSKFDDIVEKCTELGVDEICPLVTERTEISPKREAAQRMAERFQKLVVAASKQCRRLWFPTVREVMSFDEAVALLVQDGHHIFIPWLEGERVLLKDALRSSGPVSRAKGREAVVFFIGPEGDFTPEEANGLIARGATPVSLGDTVLRVETAAIAVAAYCRLV